MRVDAADIAAYLGTDIGVGGDGRAALELAVFLAQLVRGRDEHVGMARLEDGLGARLVIRAAIAMEKQDGGRLDAETGELLAERDDLVLVERALDLAIGEHALLHLEAQRALD